MDTTPDELRFDQHSRELSGAELQLPHQAADREDSARVLTTPAVRPGSLRTDEARDFDLQMTRELRRALPDHVSWDPARGEHRIRRADLTLEQDAAPACTGAVNALAPMGQYLHSRPIIART